MLTIRLARIGKKKQPTYRLIINEKTKDTFGDFLEILGNYNPRSKETNLKTDRIKYWLSKGAGTSDTVHNLLVKNKVIDDKTVKAWKPKKKRKSADEAEKKTEEDGKTEKESPKDEKKDKPEDKPEVKSENKSENKKPEEAEKTKDSESKKE